MKILALQLWLWLVIVFVGAVVLLVLFDWARTWIYLWKANRRAKKQKTFDTSRDTDNEEENIRVKGSAWNYEPKKKTKK